MVVGPGGLTGKVLADDHDSSAIRRGTDRRNASWQLRQGCRLGRIIDDLLNLSLIEAQESPSREPVPITVLVAEAV